MKIDLKKLKKVELERLVEEGFLEKIADKDLEGKKGEEVVVEFSTPHLEPHYGKLLDVDDTYLIFDEPEKKRRAFITRVSVSQVYQEVG